MKFIPSTKTMIIGCVIAVWLMLRLSADINSASILDMAGSWRLGTSVLMVGLSAFIIRVGLPFYILNKPVKHASGVKGRVSSVKPVGVDLEMAKAVMVDGVEPPKPRNVCGGDNNKFIQKGAVYEEVEAVDKIVKAYDFADIQFNLTKVPNFLIVGSVGGGKSVTSYNIIEMLNKQYDYPRFAIVDLGNQDYKNNLGNNVSDFFEVVDLLYIIQKGRQEEGRVANRTRIVFLVEEVEAALSGITLLKKDAQNKIWQKLGDVSRMGRKLEINLMFVSQNAKANLLDTSVRNQFGNIFVHQSPKRLCDMFGCKFNLSNLETGLVWYSKIDSLIKMPLRKEPDMNLITMQELKMLAKSYQRRFGIEQNIEVEV